MRNGCIYTGWGSYTACTKSCDGGTHARFRTMIGKTETATATSCTYTREDHLCNEEPCDGTAWSSADRKARLEMTLVMPHEQPKGNNGEDTLTGARLAAFRDALGSALTVRGVQVHVETLARTLVTHGTLAHCVVSIKELYKLDAMSIMVRRGAFEGLVIHGLADAPVDPPFIVSHVQNVHAVVETGAPTPAPQPCVLSDWSTFSECSKTCMAGLQHRTRSVVIQPTGGRACLSRWEARTCNDTPCPQAQIDMLDSVFDASTVADNSGVPYQHSDQAPPAIQPEDSFLLRSEQVPQPGVVPVDEDVLPSESSDDAGGDAMPPPLAPLTPEATP